jgi:hypothetical protein
LVGGCRVVIVLMGPDETEDQAWQRNLRKHPEAGQADIRMFHVPVRQNHDALLPGER